MKFIPLLLLSIIVFSCKKLELTKISTSFWNPKLAVPIAYGSFTINDILKQADSIDKYIGVSDKNVLQLSTSQSIKGFSLLNAVKIPSFESLPVQTIYSFNNMDAFGLSIINSTANSNVNKRINFSEILLKIDPKTKLDLAVPLDFSGGDLPAGFRVDKLKFAKGKIKLNVAEGLPHKTILKILFNDIQKDGKMLVDSLVYDPSNKKPLELNLANCLADFSKDSLHFKISEIIIIPNATGVINSTDKLALGVSLTEIEFDYLEGYFGKLAVPAIKESIVIDQLKDLKGTFGITNPSLTFSVNNSFGVPVVLDFTKFQLKRKAPLTPLDIAINPFPINMPKSKYKDTISSLSLDASIPNFSKLLSSETEQLDFEANIEVNKAGVNGKPNFITSKSSISIDANITVPLTGYISGFTFEDTSDISLPIDMLKSLELKVIYKNTLPVDVNAGITFLDINNNKIKDATGAVINIISSSTDKLIKSPELTYNTETNSYTIDKEKIASLPEQSFSIILKESQIPYLKNAKKVIFSGNFETFGAGSSKSVTLYDYYGLSIKLAGNAEVNSKSFLK